MAVGLSNGQSFPDESEYWGSIAAGMPLGSPEKPAGALKSDGGTDTPGNTSKVENTAAKQPQIEDRTGIPAGQEQARMLAGNFMRNVGRVQDWWSGASPQGAPNSPLANDAGIGDLYNTQLSPEEESKFQSWKAQNAPNDSGADYDLRGAYKAGLTKDIASGHWPDTYKKPNHPTFSEESIYAKDRPDLAGHWEGENHDQYVPAGRLTNQPIDVNHMLNIQRGGDPIPMPKVISHIKSLNRDITDEDIDSAINIGLSTGPGTMAGVKAISNLKGAAKSEALSNLGHAQVLEAAGEHPDVIWKQTGFGRGADGRWRHEIDDSKAVLDTNWATTHPDDVAEVFKNAGVALDTKYGQGGNNTYGLRKWKTDEKIDPANLSPELQDWWVRLHTGVVPTQKLSDILDHPELYNMYPHTKDIQVKLDPKRGDGASWNNSNTITVGPEAASNTGTIMHEVQHAIQDFEGFAKGGSPGIQGTTYQLRLADAAKKQIQEPLEDLIAKRASSRGWTEQDAAEAARLRGLAQKYLEYSAAGRSQTFTNYERLAGEAEARNTDIRLLMDKLDRRTISPRWTMDVEPSRQIVSDKPMYTDPYMK